MSGNDNRFRWKAQRQTASEVGETRKADKLCPRHWHFREENVKYWLTFVVGRVCARVCACVFVGVHIRRQEAWKQRERKSNEGEDTADSIGGKGILFLHVCCLKNAAIAPLCAHILDNLRGSLSCSWSTELFGSSSNVCRDYSSAVKQSTSVSSAFKLVIFWHKVIFAFYSSLSDTILVMCNTELLHIKSTLL